MASRKKKEELSLEEKLEQALVPVEEWPYEVPGNWCFFRFTSLIDIEGGTQPPKSQFVEEPMEGYVRLVQIRDFASDKYVVYVSDTKKLRKFNKDDVMIARYGASIGRICIGLEGAYNVALAKTIFSKEILNRDYVYWMLQSETFQNPLRTISRSAQAGFNKEDLSNFVMPLPPLHEQQRIVERIESMFTKLDEVKEKVQYILDTFENRKAAILYKAFQGVLTDKWRKKRDINILDWKQKTIKNVCNDIKVGIVIKPTQYYTESDNGVAAFRSANVREAYIEDENWVYINQIGQQENKRSEVHTGDVLVVRSGNPGTACVVTEEYDGFNAIDIIIAVPDNSQIDSKYLCYYTNSPECKRLVRENKRGMALPHFNVGGYSKLPIKVPSLEEQHEIVRIIEMEMSKEQKAKEIVQSILDEIGVMKKAILAKAFRGELETNNPDEEFAIELLKEVLMES